jgi:hypothetical protein
MLISFAQMSSGISTDHAHWKSRQVVIWQCRLKYSRLAEVQSHLKSALDQAR